MEEVSGVPFEDFMRDNVFEPAGMHATRICHRRKDQCTIENLAYGLVLPLGSHRYILADDDAGSEYVLSCDGVSGDGLVHSNILELFAWDRALREEKILTKEEQDMMYTPGRLNNGKIAEADEEAEDGYGFGWGINHDEKLGLIVDHSGGWPGYSNWYERFVDADRVLIMLRCREVMDERAHSAFFDSMRALARDEEPKPIKTIEELALQNPDKNAWDAFVGKYDYQIGDFFINEIIRKDGELYTDVSYNGEASELRLYPLGDNTFGIKDLDEDIVFGDGCLTLYGTEGRKL